MPSEPGSRAPENAVVIGSSSAAPGESGTLLPRWCDPRIPIALACIVATLFALLFPPFSGPDEVAHVAYTAALSRGALPTIPVGSGADIATGSSWQGQHPPLYYLLCAPLYLLVGRNPIGGLIAMRLVCVVCFGLTLLLLHRVATRMLPPRTAAAALWICALHPTTLYVFSMANNEALATFLSVGAVLFALQTQDESLPAPVRTRFVGIAAICGGLGLLTKLTAIAGLAGAACIVWQGGGKAAISRLRASALIAASAIWLPWGALMMRLHGAMVPSPVHREFFREGLWALVIEPQPVLIVAAVALAHFAVGLVAPYWLFAPYPAAYYPMLASGWLVSGVLVVASWRVSRWRFVGASFLALACLVVAQVLFRDKEAIIFLSRYSPTVALFAILMSADLASRWQPRIRQAVTAIWFAATAACFLFMAYFFLVGAATTTSWKR